MSSKALLSESEEKELLKLYRFGNDTKARLKLFNSHRGVVYFIVKGFYNSYKNNSVIDKDDLVQEGFYGLIKAIDEFDLTKNVRLVTYATIYIQSAIFEYITKNFGTIHISRYMARRIIKYLQAVSNFKVQYNRDPDLTELTQILNCSKEHLQNVIRAYTLSSVLRLHEDEDCQAHDSTPENYVLELEKVFELNQISQYLYEGFYLLSPGEQEIIKNYYGFNNLAGRKIKRRSRPSKTELAALRKLRRYVIANTQESLKIDLIKEGAANV